MKSRIIHSILIVFALAAVFLSPSYHAFAQDSTVAIGSAASTDHSSPAMQMAGCSPVYLDATNPSYEQRVVELVNSERVKDGLPPLKRIEALTNAARYHAVDMAVDNYFAHDSYDRNIDGLFKVCIWSTRIAGFYPTDSWLGENIAAGFSTPESVMQGWMNSKGHRDNILNPNYRELGVGYASGGYYGSYWVQDFGRISTSYPLIINNEIASTDSPNVTLYLYGEGVWNEMRLRNDGGVWTEWRAFSNSVAWTLDWIQGVRTVTVELRKTGQVTAGASASDNIELTTSLMALPNRVYLPAIVH